MQTSIVLVILLPLLLACLTGATDAQPSRNELAYTKAFCARVGGRTEVRHPYTPPTGATYIKVDCETDTTVYEAGLDRPSSLDSVQQAVFAAQVTGKTPVVVIYDTDGEFGPYEHRVRVACKEVGIQFIFMWVP